MPTCRGRGAAHAGGTLGAGGFCWEAAGSAAALTAFTGGAVGLPCCCGAPHKLVSLQTSQCRAQYRRAAVQASTRVPGRSHTTQQKARCSSHTRRTRGGPTSCTACHEMPLEGVTQQQYALWDPDRRSCTLPSGQSSWPAHLPSPWSRCSDGTERASAWHRLPARLQQAASQSRLTACRL